MSDEKVFADGMFFKKKHENVPDFVKGHVSIKVEDFIKQLEKYKNDDGWVQYDLKLSQSGKLYFELNQWRPKKEEEIETPF